MERSQNALERLNEGVMIPATPLALTSEKKFDERRQRLLIRYFLHAGAGGIATGVHSTQFEVHNEKLGLLEPVYRTVRDEITRFERAFGASIVKVAGVCGPVKQAVSEAELAKRLGFDAVLLSPSGLPELTEDDFIRRAEAVADVIPMIGFALQAAAGGRVFSFDYWQKLCEIENVAAIKAAPFNRYQTLDILRAVALSGRSGDITMYTGNDDNIGVDLLTVFRFPAGGEVREVRFDGGLLGHYTFWTKRSAELFAEFKRARDSGGVSTELLTIAANVTETNAAVFDAKHNFKGCISGIHEVLRRQGLMEGIWCLNENERLSPGQAEEITRVAEAYPDLTDDSFVAENIDRWRAEL